MPAVLLSTGANRREVGVFPEAILINMLAEAAPSDVEKGIDLIARPGLQPFTTTGSAIRGVVRRSGVFNGDALVVSGTTVYRVTESGVATALAGAVPGYALVSIDSTAIAGVSEARIANGSGVYVCDGTTVTAETFPDDAGVTAVCTLRGFWFAIRASTQTVYSREPGASAWTALAFTSAESEPDLLVGLATLGDYVVLFGEETAEFHALTGSANPAIQPVDGLRSDKGCFNRNTVALCDNSLFFVGHDCCVYRLDTRPKIVSDNALAEQIRLAGPDNLRAWSFTIDGHALYVLTLGSDATYVYDASTERWSRFKSRDYDHWRAHLGTNLSGRILAADSESGALWLVDPNRINDYDVEIERYATGLIPVLEGGLNVENLRVRCSVGAGDGAGGAADLSVRTSKDNGRTFGNWRTTSLGMLGDYKRDPTFWRLGQVKAPGMVVQLRCTDETTYRLSDVRFNAK